jgi:H2-forming N5,N10-methylenetetrahydromethanopterin dehydrogenase-like enzyme
VAVMSAVADMAVVDMAVAVMAVVDMAGASRRTAWHRMSVPD